MAQASNAGGRRKKSIAVAVAIAYGKLCAGCGDGSCHGEPTLAQPVLLSESPCPVCKGGHRRKLCPNCRGWGKDVLIGCPRKLILPGTYDILQAADFARKALWPIAGGWLDQANHLLQAVQHVWTCETPHRIKFDD